MANSEKIVFADGTEREINVAFLRKMMKNMKQAVGQENQNFEKRKAGEEGKTNRRYTLKVYPAGMGRTAYRVIEIDGKESLTKLCNTIIHAFDFESGHLYEFCMDNRMYSWNSYQYDPDRGQRSTNAKINSLHLVKGQKFSLHYDFGDDWMFTITVQKIEFTADYVKPKVIKEKGVVEQYPDWDEDFEDEEEFEE